MMNLNKKEDVERKVRQLIEDAWVVDVSYGKYTITVLVVNTAVEVKKFIYNNHELSWVEGMIMMHEIRDMRTLFTSKS